MKPNALFLGTFEDKQYLPLLKPFFKDVTTYTITDPVNTLTELEIYCDKRNINSIASTSKSTLEKLLIKIGGAEYGNPSIDNYSGSFFTFGARKQIDIVFIDPLKQLVTVPYGKFIAERFISKLLDPTKWNESTTFQWELLDTPGKIEQAYEELKSAYVISIDIETVRKNLAIKCISFTSIYISQDNRVTTNTFVIPFDSLYNHIWVRKICSLPNPKLFQNGKYDNAYLLRFNICTVNWLWDTAHLMHSWYSELPKDLAFLNAFFLRKVIYWKDLSKTSDLFEYYKYNAMDSWATANVWLVQMQTAPDWAYHNYFLEFPLVYPCLLSEFTGLRRDTEKLNIARKECDEEFLKESNSLNKILGTTFNANSPIQVKTLLKILTGKDWESSDESHLEKVAFLHPFNRVIIDKIKKIREVKKRKSTYLRTDEDIKRLKDGTPAANSNGSKDYKGFWLYSLNPHGTDTGRLASGESSFWCGANIQNVETGRHVKQTLGTYTGFKLAECDLKQAETRDTAYIIGSESLIKAVEGDRDFHSINASAFFGTPYNAIFDDPTGKVKNKKLRDLAKRTNHGANYNMGSGVLVETMGEQKIWEAIPLLGLPKNSSSKEVAEYLLERFHNTYPELKNAYYPWVIRQVLTTRKLTSNVRHHIKRETNSRLSESNSQSFKYSSEYNSKSSEYKDLQDWTRYCFGQPDKNKRDLNAYVAHCPQSLNSRTLNEAYMQIFYELALPHADKFLLHAQIHDSILFSFKEGSETFTTRVKQLMEIPVTIQDVSGKVKTFTVPADIKAGKDSKGVDYWSDVE